MMEEEKKIEINQTMQNILEETQEQKSEFCSQILAEIMLNLQKSTEQIDRSHLIQKTLQTPNLLKHLTLQDFVQNNNQEILETLEFPKTNSEEKFQLNHLKVHQQVIWNLCGYHSTFSQLQILNMLKSQSLDYPYLLNDSASFWKHHFATTKFLLDYANNKNKLKDDKWPWQYKTVQFGDFERTFSKVSFQNNPEFLYAIKNENNFEIETIVFQFQFGRVIHDAEDDAMKMQKSFTEFNQFSTPNVHKIIAFQMGITNHWALLIAHKINQKVEFWFLDSKNLNFLKWDDARIQQHIQERNEEKIKNNQEPLTPYKQMIAKQCILDFQQALNLLVNCLIGNQILQVYMVQKQIQVVWKMFLQDNTLIEKIFKQNNNNLLSFFSEPDQELINLAIQEQLETWTFCYQKQYNHIFEEVQKYQNLIGNETKDLFQQQEIFFLKLYEYLQQENVKKLNLQLPSLNKIFKKRQASQWPFQKQVNQSKI